MAIHVLENYVSVEEYARLCGKKRRAIMDRIKAKGVSAIKVDGYYAIDIVASPPVIRNHPSARITKGGVHVAHPELRCVIAWCWGKEIRCYPFLRAIINGKLEGWLIGDEVFAKAEDLEAFRKKRK
jgi:hypothetical protein